MLKEKIQEKLRKIEQEQNARILFACESGSRAWGFASPDSDYDVRFIYLNPLEWHLRLQEQRDNIERMLPGNLDLSGWELAKTLRLFHSCNLGLNEWLNSPIVYLQDENFVASLRELMPEYFNPKKALFHYLAMARNKWESFEDLDQVKIKAVFYVLRPLLACEWIAERNAMPPTEFRFLHENESTSEELKNAVIQLLERKKEAVEQQTISLSETLRQWMPAAIEHIEKLAHETAPGPKQSWQPLNELFQTWVM